VNKLVFEISNDCLYAANTGRAFDRTGVVSVSTQHLSSKGARSGLIATLDCPDEDLVEAIQELQIRQYRINPNQLIADRNAEDETSRDYAGRCLLELLQNADDAMAPDGVEASDLIGAKGLGFKSVLEVTDSPKVFSGPFSFGFDRARSREALKGLSVSDEVGIFRIPHAEAPDAVVEALRSQGFATVVKLPFRDAAVRARVEIELAALQPHFLLLSQHLRRVDIKIGAVRRRIERSGGDGEKAGAEVRIQVWLGRCVEHDTSWRIWRDAWAPSGLDRKRLSVAMAVQMVDGRLAPTAAPLPLHVFYPTEEHLSAHLLIHASFDVTQNRQRLRAGTNDADLLERVGAMTARIAVEERSVDVLQVFKRLAAEAPRTKPRTVLPRLIAHAIRQALVDTEFVPVISRGRRRVAPRDARIAAQGFAGLLDPAIRKVAEAGIVKSELEPVHDVLQNLDGRLLAAADYAQLFPHVRCASVGECIAAARAMLRTCLVGSYLSPAALTGLKEAPIWPLADNGVRALAGPTPLLLARPADWPGWCEADALDLEFAAEVFPNGAIPKEWERLATGVILTETRQYLERCISPAAARWDDAEWSRLGWEALDRVERWAGIGDWTKMKPYAPRAGLGSTRDALVGVMRVPTGRGWSRGRSCYARTEIKGSGALSRFFKSVPGRELCGYPSEARRRFTAERWRSLLRYLGVSWEPKILLLEGDADAVLPGPDHSAYSFEIGRTDGLRYLNLDWCLEAFPECLADPGPAATLMEMVASVQMTSADLTAEWFKVSGTSKTHAPSSTRSFVSFQLRRSPYLPVKPNIWGKRVVGGSEAFWPQGGIRGITPDLDLAGFKDPRRNALKPTLSAALRFRTKLPESWADWLAWNAALVAAVERGEVPGGLRSARDFYELMLETKPVQDAAPPAKVVCVDPGSPTGLKAVPRNRATWIDRPALAAPEVLGALAAAGLSYLPALLGTAPNASARLGIVRATERVVISPSFEEAPSGQARLERRLEARWRAIAVQCEHKRVKPPPMPELRAVHGLTLRVSLGWESVAEIASTAFRHADAWLIDIGNEWEAVAAALSDGMGHAADLRYRFAAILRAQNGDAVLRLLLEDGIPGYKLTALRLDDSEDAVGEDGAAVRDTSGASAEPDPAGVTDDGSTAAAPPPPPPSPSPSPSPPPAPPSRPAGNQFASGTLARRALYDAPVDRDGSRSGGGGWSNQQAAGLAGEEWLRGLVRQRLPQGWSLTTNERDEAAGESDLIVRSPTSEWHVEIKTLSSERLYWSDLERGKAERQQGRYWMCFLVRQAYAWRIHWSWNPLVDLLPCERRLQWQWARESEGPRLAKGSWQPIGGTAAPTAVPDRATAVIRMLDPQVRALPEDNVLLKLFWQRVHGPLGGTQAV
jgi:hypothetical protein